MNIMFKAQTVEGLQAEVVRFLRFRAEQEVKNGKAVDRTFTENLATQSRAKALLNVADTIEKAELLKDILDEK